MLWAIVDSGAAIAMIVALGISVVLRLLPGRWRDALWVIAPAVVVGLWQEDIATPDRYRDFSGQYGDPLALPVAAGTIAAVALMIWSAERSSFDGSGGGDEIDWSVPMAVAAVGVALCVPETQVALLLAGSILAAAILVAVGWLNRVGPGQAVVIVTALGWVVAVDGGSRWSAVVGGLACLVAIGLWGVRPATPSVRWSSRATWCGRVLVLTAVAVVCARPAGTHPSATIAAVLSAVALMVGWLSLVGLGRLAERSGAS